jgi:uncharacterized phage protein gp47/JayE
MSFKLPPMSQTREFLVALFKAVLPDRNVGTTRSAHYRRLTVTAAAATQIHKHVESVRNDVMPNRADDVGITEWGEEVKGIPRKSATPARKTAAGRVRGLAAATATSGEQLIHESSGLLFTMNTNVTIPGAAPNNYVDADIVAVSTGSATRLKAGEILKFVNSIPNIETNVVLVKDLDEDGFDREQFGAYRSRVLASFSGKAAGGTQDEFVAWALEVPGVDYAFAYPNRAGIGTVDVVGLHVGSGSARILTVGENAALLAHLKTKVPATLGGIGGALRVLTVIDDPEAVEILVTPNGDGVYAFDWDDVGVTYTITAWNAGTRTATLSAMPPSLKAGHRIVVKGIASVQDGRQYKVEAITGALTIKLETSPTNAFVNTDIVYAGGPLVDPIRDAVVGHLNGETVYAGRGGVPLAASSPDLATTVGVEVLAEGIGPANPAGKYGTWNGALLRNIVGKIVSFKTGVRNYSVTVPATDIEATDYAFPLDSQIGLITASSVIVRRG